MVGNSPMENPIELCKGGQPVAGSELNCIYRAEKPERIDTGRNPSGNRPKLIYQLNQTVINVPGQNLSGTKPWKKVIGFTIGQYS